VVTGRARRDPNRRNDCSLRLDLPAGYASGYTRLGGVVGNSRHLYSVQRMYIILLCRRGDDGGRSGKLVLAGETDTVLKKINKQKHRP